MNQPLLELDGVRIDRDGCCVLDAVSLRATGARIGLVGQGHQVFEALAGAAEVTAGRLLIGGVELEEARSSTLFTVARPWTARAAVTLHEGLVLSALLGGCTRSDARQRATMALDRLGLAHLGRQTVARRPKVELYLAGLAEAALFDSPVVVAEWPIGVLDPDAWARYGTALARLIHRKQWVAWVPGSARLAVEQSWIGALDQLIWIEPGMAVNVGTDARDLARVLLVLDASNGPVPDGLERAGLRLESVALTSASREQRAAYVVEVARDEFGHPDLEPILAWCDDHGVPILRLLALEQGR